MSRSGAGEPSRFAGLFRPVPGDSLALFRIAFGLILFWEVTRYLQYGWIADYYIEPTVYFTYYGFSWVKPLAGRGMFVLFGVIGVAALAFAAGFLYRVSAALLFLGISWIFLLDQTHYLNHIYLVILLLFLLILVPAHRAWSVDDRLRPAAQSGAVPLWALWTLRLQFGLVYLYAGFAKLNPDWLRLEPARMWMQERTEFPWVGAWIDAEPVVFGIAYGGLLLDLLAFPLLLWRRSRLWMLAACIVFHSANKYLFNIGIFPWAMVAGTLLFLRPDWPRVFLDWMLARDLRGTAPERPDPEIVDGSWETRPAGPGALPRGAPLLLGFLALWFAFQLLFPFRHLLYPGRPAWTEEGHRFAWHMKLRNKTGRAVYRVVSPSLEREKLVRPRTHLTAKQARKSATRPDMALQFAHYLRDLHEERWGVDDVEVYMDGRVSLNGRRAVPMIDPERDLAAVPRSLGRADWILPLTEPLKSAEPKAPPGEPRLRAVPGERDDDSE